MTPKDKKIIFISCFLLLVLGFFVWHEIYLPASPLNSQTRVFSVKKGEGTKEISVNLKKEGLIKDATFFRLYALTIQAAGKLQAGDYSLSPSMSVAEIVKKFVSGDVIRQKVTLVEGWDIKDMADYFEKQNLFSAEDFMASVGTAENWSRDFDFLEDKPKNLDLEGYLFPDTYEIEATETPEDLVRMTLENFGQKLTAELRQEIKSQDKTIFEIVTMASLIEKEVKTQEDKKLVSGILWKRLAGSVPLQVDATISYITGKNTTRVSIDETKIDSPYNTYKYRGLPLGPICSPGLESILAALYPQDSPYWYYLSTPDGETIFSKTLEEHNKARAQYLKTS
jgi:UPF0755 protein